MNKPNWQKKAEKLSGQILFPNEKWLRVGHNYQQALELTKFEGALEKFNSNCKRNGLGVFAEIRRYSFDTHKHLRLNFRIGSFYFQGERLICKSCDEMMHQVILLIEGGLGDVLPRMIDL